MSSNNALKTCPLCKAIPKLKVWALFEEHEEEGICEAVSLFMTEELAERHWKELDETVMKTTDRGFHIGRVVIWGEE